jgi:hypothetical protein
MTGSRTQNIHLEEGGRRLSSTGLKNKSLRVEMEEGQTVCHPFSASQHRRRLVPERKLQFAPPTCPSLVKKLYRPGEGVFFSGVYLAVHIGHREAHRGVLLRNEVFPACRTCLEGVAFELICSAGDLSEDQDFTEPPSNQLAKTA